MAAPVYDPKTTNVFELLRNEEDGQLEKVARQLNDVDQEILQHKTFPKAEVGSACLRRVFHFEDPGDPTSLTGSQVSVQTWTQELEDLANPPLTALNLSNLSVQDGAPAGTTVGIISTVGGSEPITFSIISDPSSKFRIDNDNELTLDDEADVADVSYSVTLRALDGNSNVLDQAFVITVLAFSNVLSTLFDGVNEHATVPSTANFQFDKDEAFSVSFWVQYTTTSGNRGVYNTITQDATARGIEITTPAGGNEIRFNIIADAAVSDFLIIETNASGITNSNWFHVVVTYSGSGLATGQKIYVNAVNQAVTVSQAGPLVATTVSAEDLFIGARPALVNFMNGNLDELAIYDIELTSGQVTEIYNSGTPISLLTTTFTDPIHWWRMGDGDTFPTMLNQIASAPSATMVNMEAGDFVSDTPP